ncbi:MAG: hypothetical protein KJ626_08450 [Verrucomicrobia bacterium]|nr:hypothetical protein [Verrucomicrobiota bacterium]
MKAGRFERRRTDRHQQVKSLLEDEKRKKAAHLGADTYFLDDESILALPRRKGDSRYPYGADGFNFWVYASGVMHCNEGLFSSFVRPAFGEEPRIAFFAGLPLEQGGFFPIPLTCVPQTGMSPPSAVNRFTVFEKISACFFCETPELQFCLRVHVSPDKSIVFSLLSANVSDREQLFYQSSFLNPFMRNQFYESSEDNWFKEVRLEQNISKSGSGLRPFVVTTHEDKNRHTSFTNRGWLHRGLNLSEGSDIVSCAETTSRLDYVGTSVGGLHSAESLREGAFASGGQPVCTFTDSGVMADILLLRLAPGGFARQDLVFESREHIADEGPKMSASLSADDLDDQLELLEKKEDVAGGHFSIAVHTSRVPELKAAVFNGFFGQLKKQVEFCSVLKGYVQLSANSLIGIRDVFQSLEAYLYWAPDKARAKMLEALDFTAPDGRCFRQYSLPTAAGQTGRMDLRPFIDQGVWVVSCIWHYLRVTGDWAFLHEECGYHAIVDESAGVVAKTAQRDTVMQHMIRITDYLIENRDHENTRCVLALYGDWNDALDGLGISRDGSREFGTGVSVMASLQVFQNTQEMIELLKHVDEEEFSDKIAGYRQAGEEIKRGLIEHAVVERDGRKRIVHGWGDKRSYYVGSFEDSDGKSRDGLTSNAFWVLSGLLDFTPEMKETILESFKRLDSRYGLKTFEPYFARGTPGVGRIPNLPAGTAENAAAYIHATAFGIAALFQMDHPKEAWEQLVKILPFTPIHKELTHSPFVMPNSYCENADLHIDGESMNDWQTGSANTVMKLFIRYVFGLNMQADGAWIEPAAWCPFRRFSVEIAVRGSVLRLSYADEGAGQRHFMVNGEVREEGLRERALWIGADELCNGELSVTITD